MDVTVVEAYVNSDYFQGKNAPIYPYTVAGVSAARMQWSGDTANALGTYGGVNTIIAQATLVYNTFSTPHKLTIGAGVGGKLGLGNTGTHTYDIWADSSAIYFGYYLSTMATLNTTRWQFHEPIRIDDIAGGGNQLVTVDNDGDLGATRDIEVDSINFGDSASNISLDSSGKLTFTDEAGGPYELSELVGGGGGVSVNGTPTNNQFAVWTDASTIEGVSAMEFDGSTITIANNMYKNANGLIIGRDADNYIGGSSGGSGYISIFGGGDEILRAGQITAALTVYAGIYPGSGSTYNLGTSSFRWENLYVNNVYIEDVNTFISQDSAGNMIFKDAAGGPYELSELASGGGSMVYPGAGIAVSTGSAWDTSLTDNSSNWNTAYSHSQITTGNPHSIGYADISDFNTGVGTYETSHSDVVVDGDFSSNGILRRTGAGSYAALTGSSSVDTVETTLTDDDTHIPTSGAVYGAIAGAGGMVYPGAGIAVSTGSAWDTSITDNSSNWNTAYSHSQITTGNPHSIGYADIADFATGVANNETSHSDVVVDGDFSANGILRRTGAGSYAALTASSSVDTIETTLTDDDTHLPTSGAVYAAIAGAGGMVYPGAGIAVSTGSAWGTSITDNSTNWNTAYTHSQLTVGNPHSIGYADISDFNTGVSTYETSHATVVTASSGSSSRVPVFTGAYTVQGYTNFLYTGTLFTVGTFATGATMKMHNASTTTNLDIVNDGTDAEIKLQAYGTSSGVAPTLTFVRYGGSYASPAAGPSNSIIKEELYYLHDGASAKSSGYQRFEVTGAVATDNFNTQYSWYGHEGSDTSPNLQLQLNHNGLSIPQTLYVDTITEYTGAAGVTIEGVSLEDTVVTFPAGTSYGVAFNNAATALITSSGLGQLSFYIGGALHAQFNGTDFTTAVDFLPTSSKAFDLGSSSAYFDNAYVDRLYVDSALVYIDVSGTEMELTDSTGSYTLSDLSSGAGVWDENSDGEAVLTASAGHILVDYHQELRFGNDKTYMTPSSPSAYMYFYAGTGPTQHLSIGAYGIWPYYDIIPNNTHGDVSLGAGAYPFTELYVSDIYAAALPSGDQSETIQFNTSNGRFTYYDDTSDIRLKKDRKPITNASARIREWDIFSFRFNELAKKEMNHDTERVRMGMSAQSVQANTPEIVTTKKHNGYLKLWYDQVIPILAAAHNEHSEELEQLRAEVESLKKLLKK